MRTLALAVLMTVGAPLFAAPATGEELLTGAPARIEQHRKADLKVVVLDAAGKPVRGARVSVRQTRHTFLFGCNAFPLLRYTVPGQEALFEQRFTGLFNYATLGFYWGAYESSDGATKESEARLRRQAEWLRDHGIAVKGHPLVWHEVYPAWGPKEAGPARDRLRRRVTDLVGGFAGLIDRWDVVNEATVSSRFDNGFGKWVKRDGASSVVQECLGWARSANPSASLLYNDYNLGSAYEALARDLKASKAPVNALGLQSHMHRDDWPLQRVWDACETYARFGLPLHFTELTVLSGEHGWERPRPWPSTPDGEARQARYVADLYTLLFSHPAVEAITWWDLMDGEWQGAPAGLVRKDLSHKPAYERLRHLIRTEWWTSVSAATDGHGEVRVRGFLGDYAVTCQNVTAKTAIRRDGPNTVTLRLAAGRVR